MQRILAQSKLPAPRQPVLSFSASSAAVRAGSQNGVRNHFSSFSGSSRYFVAA
jgi:hypothetical protein